MRGVGVAVHGDSRAFGFRQAASVDDGGVVERVGEDVDVRPIRQRRDDAEIGGEPGGEQERLLGAFQGRETRLQLAVVAGVAAHERGGTRAGPVARGGGGGGGANRGVRRETEVIVRAEQTKGSGTGRGPGRRRGTCRRRGRRRGNEGTVAILGVGSDRVAEIVRAGEPRAEGGVGDADAHGQNPRRRRGARRRERRDGGNGGVAARPEPRDATTSTRPTSPPRRRGDGTSRECECAHDDDASGEGGRASFYQRSAQVISIRHLR